MIRPLLPRVALKFFRSGSGREPVREWLKDLESVDRTVVGKDLMRVQWRWPIGMPLCRAMGQGLWEVRTELPSGRIARVLICFSEGCLIALHGFIKKSRTTPDEDLALARKRHKELQ